MKKVDHRYDGGQGGGNGTSRRASAVAQRAAEVRSIDSAIAEMPAMEPALRPLLESARKLLRAAEKGRDDGALVGMRTPAEERLRVQANAVQAAERWARERSEQAAECLVYFCELAEALREPETIEEDRAYVFGILDAIMQRAIGGPDASEGVEAWVARAAREDAKHPLLPEWLESFNWRAGVLPDAPALARARARVEALSGKNKIAIVSELSGIPERTLKDAARLRDL